MVDRLFETPIVKCESDIYTDMPLDKDAFVEQVYKKKRGRKDEILAVSAGVARHIQLPDSKSQVHGGGYSSIEDNVRKRPHAAKNLPGATEWLATNSSGEHLRRMFILAAVKANGSALAGALSSGQNSDKLNTDNSSIGISKNNTSHSYVSLMQSVSPAPQVLNGKSAMEQKKSVPDTTAANAAITNAHLSFAELQTLTQSTEIAKGRENQSASMHNMLQKTVQNSTTASKHDAAGRSFDISYPFQRWAGDHSVKVSIPTEARRDANITLLPSDTRAADVLSRQMVHLSGHAPELLKPEQDNEERERHQQQQDTQDEEQE
ncbi:hypothetical protein LOZ86_18915 [Pectobacterium parvum]|uniref:Type III secretion system needle length determinant, SpaN/EivJ family n=1 Tax=Pectobacterium parvum TaxID=2778550 RepID=A0AAP9IFE3_9GAMM|nr:MULTISPECIES: type III secretion system needle length determinant, SpaN/EivJ family [Pectobacterium]GKW40837.1 hypothetical protein PEC301879_06960 [Pectobacterium carotovorum subsp. carotovorum]MCU1800733.1 hypothetical protein [Pectobacterium parvum]QHQ23268.1 hypothetical protein GMX10_03610 [Pectobacterium parvum]UFK38931.1 hypothetical protein LOZ86_18915 [Pectobacterium parvum]UVD97052.1 hypothetical protein NV347_18940 [Pectobacterium parvum]